MQIAIKVLVCGLGIALFASNPWRDLEFYMDIAAHEGFGTDKDSYIIGFAYQLLTTFVFLPVAIGLICYGVIGANKVSIFPRVPHKKWYAWLWVAIASFLGMMMTIIEVDLCLYCVPYSHHWDTIGISCAYVSFIYVWWCCSLEHGGNQNESPVACNRWQSEGLFD